MLTDSVNSPEDEVSEPVIEPTKKNTAPFGPIEESVAAISQPNATIEDDHMNNTIEAEFDTIPLSADELPQSAPVELPHPIKLAEPYIQVAQRCDVGVVRKRNEDSCFSFVSLSGGQDPLIPFALFLVADGMGGHHAGHEASRTVSFQVAQHIMEKIYMPLMREQTSDAPIQEIIQDAIERANQSIRTNDPEKEGGTTLTGCVIVGRRLYLVHVGDSRAYLFSEGHRHLLTKDHSIVQRLQEAGHITAEQAATHPHRNLLYRAVTGNELEIDTYTRTLPKTGYLLLCSDGLWGSIEDTDLEAVIVDESISLQDRCDTLIQKAIDGGSTDNVTALIIKYRV